MARRRKEPDESPRGFDFPEFDESGFIRKETISFRSAMVLFVWSILAAAVSFVVWMAVASETTGWLLGLVIMAGMLYLLRWILPAMKVDTEHFGKKEWFGTGALFFFSWLAFFILLFNPPIYDGVEPNLEIEVTPSAQEPGGVVNITLIATDNVGVDLDTIEFNVTGPQGESLASTGDLWLAVDDYTGVWAWGFNAQQNGTYRVEASVSDVKSGSLIHGVRKSSSVVEFQVGDVLDVRISGGGVLATPTDRVTVQLPAEVDVYRAWLEVTRADNTTVPVFLQQAPERSDDETQLWFAEADFRGFQQGENRFRVHVEEHATYFLELRFDGLGTMVAPLVSAESYTVRIDDAGLLGDVEPGLPGERDPTVQPVPGPAAVLTLLAVLVLLSRLRRWRRRDLSAPLSGA